MPSIPPLVVLTHESIGAGQLVITDEHRRHDEMLVITVGQLLEIEPMPVLREDEIKRKYVRGKPLVEPEEVKNLPTRMYELHQWYMNITKISNRESLMVICQA